MPDLPNLAAIEARCAAATPGPWRAPIRLTEGGIFLGTDLYAGERYIASASYGDELDPDFAFIAHARTDVPALLSAVRALEAEKKAAEAERSIHPNKCPFTGRPFFMVIDGLATYGGPFDSYTIPERDDDGELLVRRYDHDEGGWTEWQSVPAQVVADENLMALTERAEAAEAERDALRALVREQMSVFDARDPRGNSVPRSARTFCHYCWHSERDGHLDTCRAAKALAAPGEREEG